MLRFAPLALASLLTISVACAQNPASISDNYRKLEIMIPMRDGTKLYTSVLVPKVDDGKKHPMMLMRTPYSCGPYGSAMPGRVGGSQKFIEHKYIFVTQDVRGRYMSEGDFLDVRPELLRRLKPSDIDESTDTYDTIEYLVKNVPMNNGRVGMWGISYPGGYAALGAMSKHPALKAASPQAPTADWFIGDDFHHHGVIFVQDAVGFYSGFGGPRTAPSQSETGIAKIDDEGDAFKYYLKLGPLSNVNAQLFHEKSQFWNLVSAHPNYDEFWQSRSMPENLKDIKCALLNVGGWFDAEDAYGPQACYRGAAKLSPGIWNGICLGPWYHGMWHDGPGTKFGRLNFATATSTYFQEEVEFPFFAAYLEGDGKAPIAKATVFQTGKNVWRKLPAWPPAGRSTEIYLGDQSRLDATPGRDGSDEYTSDPASPVPYQGGVNKGRTREYMIDDQTFASKRPDVLSFSGPVLTQERTIAGPIDPDIYLQTDATDADLVVKVIDVWPANGPINPGFEQLLRGDIFRARFRDSYSNPRPLAPGKTERIQFHMNDLFHTFLPGHRIMVQIQSSWFPLCERNPQTYIDSFQAKSSDFRSAKIRILHGKGAPSGVRLNEVTGF